MQLLPLHVISGWVAKHTHLTAELVQHSWRQKESPVQYANGRRSYGFNGELIRGFAKIFGDFLWYHKALVHLVFTSTHRLWALFQYLASESHCLCCCFQCRGEKTPKIFDQHLTRLNGEVKAAQCMREPIRDYVVFSLMQRIHKVIKVGFQEKQEST